MDYVSLQIGLALNQGKYVFAQIIEFYLKGYLTKLSANTMVTRMTDTLPPYANLLHICVPALANCTILDAENRGQAPMLRCLRKGLDWGGF